MWPIIEREPTSAVLAGLAERPVRLQLIEGPAGVGKSALAASIRSALRDRVAVSITGLAERAATPLAALDDVFAVDGVGGVDASSDAVTSAVAALARDAARRLLLVDDVSRLDEASAEVVRRLVDGFGVAVVATARDGEPWPEALRRLDDDGLVERHRLEGLDVDETARLLEARFRVPVRDEDVRRLVWETAGNPLHLRVVVEAAIDTGEVLHRGEFVELARTSSQLGLSEVIAARLTQLTPEALRLLRVISLTQPVPRARILVAAGRAVPLDELHRHGLVVESSDGRLRIAHPLVSETLDVADPEAAVAEAVPILRASGEPSRRFAALDLERRAGGRVAAAELVWAAGYASARGDHALAAALAGEAAGHPARRADAFAAHLAAATYHSLAGELEEADRLFAQAAELAREPGERAALAGARGDHLASRRNDPAAANAQAELVRATLTDRESVALDAEIWRWRELAGIAARSGHDGDAQREWRAAITASVAASMRGEPSAAGIAARPLTVPRALLGPLAATAGIALGLQRTVELRAAGATAEAAAYLESARAEDRDEVGYYTVMLAAQRMHEGRLADALELAELAVEQFRRSDEGELLAFALAVRATVVAQRGDAVAAAAQIAELADHVVQGAAVLQRAECEAFVRAAEGDRAGAIDILLDVVTDAIASGYRFLAASTLTCALRLGDVDRVATLAEELCAGMPEHVEPCVAVREFAVALRDRQLDGVGSAARRLAAAGLVTAAIDGVVLALGMPSAEDVRRELHALATELSEGVDAPPLQIRQLPALTPRELEVARAAAARLRAREIGERLGISARTVENQLQSAYRKLGVESRDELRDALAEIGLLTDVAS